MTRYTWNTRHNLHNKYVLYRLCALLPIEKGSPEDTLSRFTPHRKRVPGRHCSVLYFPIEKGSLEDTLIWCIGIPSKWKNRVTQCDKKNNSIVSVKIVSYICVILQK